MRRGILGGMFDFNRDGKMNAFERAAEFHFLQNMEREDELAAAGLDRDELSWMDADERRVELGGLGLDLFDDEDDF